MTQERIRPRRESAGPAGGPGSVFDRPADDPTVLVSHGPYAESLPLAEMSVGEIRRRFGDRFDIDPESQAILDGREVGSDTVVRAGQHLVFTRRSGEKGARAGTRNAGAAPDPRVPPPACRAEAVR